VVLQEVPLILREGADSYHSIHDNAHSRQRGPVGHWCDNEVFRVLEADESARSNRWSMLGVSSRAYHEWKVSSER
jgi:hypothetical protein